MSNRYKNLDKKISEFQKEDNINNLTKQTLFDHNLTQGQIETSGGVDLRKLTPSW
jgi:hypothetical protein